MQHYQVHNATISPRAGCQPAAALSFNTLLIALPTTVTHRQLFIYDRTSSTKFLVDTGRDISATPLPRKLKIVTSFDFKLQMVAKLEPTELRLSTQSRTFSLLCNRHSPNRELLNNC
uniref:Uncharacterized protein n=1 Tax=Bactrocera latifrons TaxID=174628 RepID=A0A0K8W6L8_BACLA